MVRYAWRDNWFELSEILTCSWSTDFAASCLERDSRVWSSFIQSSLTAVRSCIIFSCKRKESFMICMFFSKKCLLSVKLSFNYEFSKFICIIWCTAIPRLEFRLFIRHGQMWKSWICSKLQGKGKLNWLVKLNPELYSDSAGMHGSLAVLYGSAQFFYST